MTRFKCVSTALFAGLILLMAAGCKPGKLLSLTPVPSSSPISTLSATPVTSNASWVPHIEEINGVKMALVPAGCFMMGTTAEQAEEILRHCEESGNYCDPEMFVKEQPVHQVCFEEPFWIDVYEVTNEAFGSVEKYNWTSEKPDQPRSQVIWPQALAYCEARGARLPTEAEWEYAARGPDSLIYPWGNTFAADKVVHMGNAPQHSRPRAGAPNVITAPVGSIPGGVSWVGVYDLSGNVEEWVNDRYDAGYYAGSPSVNPQGPEGKYSHIHVQRGGSFFSSWGRVHAASRELPPGYQSETTGFRCAVSHDRAVRSESGQPPVPAPSPTPTPTLVPEVGRQARERAEAGVTSNAAWEPYIEESNGMKMALVPAGCFQMGGTIEALEDGFRRCKEREPEGFSVGCEWIQTLQPQSRQVCFEQPYWIDVYEVTNEAFGLSYSGYEFSPESSNEPEQPTTLMGFDESQAYCLSRGVRLPSDAEWEYAARGPDSLIYPWGNTFMADNVVFAENSQERTAPVGSKPGGVSWVGVYDLSGNVEEWVDTWLDSGYYTRPPSDLTEVLSPHIVVRGGSWRHDTADYFRADIRYSLGDMRTFWQSVERGFRCARSYYPEQMLTPTPPPTADPVLSRQAHAAAEAGATSNAGWTPYSKEVSGTLMSLVPAGCFMMGSTDEQIEMTFRECDNNYTSCNEWPEDEQPAHRVCFEEPYWIDTFEVTNETFGSVSPSDAENPPLGFYRPRRDVKWREAQAHCVSRGARLPTEAEWEYAARGPDSLIYPWGNTIVAGNAVVAETVMDWMDYPSPVGSRPNGVSWAGLYDLGGNVREWVNDWYGAGYYAGSPTINPQGPASGDAHVLRDGDPMGTYIRAAYRSWFSEDEVWNWVGFRCALSYSP